MHEGSRSLSSIAFCWVLWENVCSLGMIQGWVAELGDWHRWLQYGEYITAYFTSSNANSQTQVPNLDKAIQGGLTPGIHYTRSNFFVKGGKVTTPTITGDIFPPCDVKNTLIKLNNQLPNFSHMPTHLSLTHSLLTLYNVALNLAHC